MKDRPFKENSQAASPHICRRSASRLPGQAPPAHQNNHNSHVRKNILIQERCENMPEVRKRVLFLFQDLGGFLISS